MLLISILFSLACGICTYVAVNQPATYILATSFTVLGKVNDATVLAVTFGFFAVICFAVFLVDAAYQPTFEDKVEGYLEKVGRQQQ